MSATCPTCGWETDLFTDTPADDYGFHQCPECDNYRPWWYSTCTYLPQPDGARKRWESMHPTPDAPTPADTDAVGALEHVRHALIEVQGCDEACPCSEADKCLDRAAYVALTTHIADLKIRLAEAEERATNVDAAASKLAIKKDDLASELATLRAENKRLEAVVEVARYASHATGPLNLWETRLGKLRTALAELDTTDTP